MHLQVHQSSITDQHFPTLFTTALILLSMVSIVYPISAVADNFEKRSHFIVLIRDTPEMYDNSNHPERIKETLPSLLFQGDNSISSREKQYVPLPVYQPNDDYISVVFTSVGGCQNSLSPKKLFRGESLKKFPNEDQFGNFLGNLITARKTDKCHGKEFAATFAQQIILPYIQDQLQQLNTKTLRFSDTVLIEINNDIPTSVGSEEASLRKQQINDIDKAKSLVDSTSSYFSTDFELDWLFKVSNQKNKRGAYEIHRGTTSFPQGNPITYKFYKIKPKINIGNYIENYKPEIRLDRIATSQEKLRLIDEQRGGRIELSIRTDSKVTPETLLLKFIGKGESTWQIGQYAFPPSKLIDLTNCNECSQQEGVIHIPILEATMDEEVFLKPTDDKPLLPVRMQFQVRFHYSAENIYTYSYIDSEVQTTKIQPVEPIKIEKSPPFEEIVLDNRELTNRFDRAKDLESGLPQTKARDRILASREEERESKLAKQQLAETISRIYWTIAALIVFIMIWFWLYKRFYDRRFEPELEWQPADEIEVNFNQQVGSRLLVGSLLFRNRGSVPWFGYLLNNRVYPDYNLKFSLSYSKDELQQYGLNLTEDEPFGFMGVRQPSSPMSKLVREMEYRVSNNTPIYLFLATEEIQDISADHLQELYFSQEDTPAIVVNMQWGSRSQHLSKLSFKVDLIREQPKLPEITYLGKTKKCNFSKGDFVPIGKLHFASKATRQFAQPFEEEFKILSYKNGLLLPEEAVKMKGGNKIQVPPRQTVEVGVEIFCDGTTVSNPDSSPYFQEYSFDLIGDFASTSQRGPYHFTLYRDPTPADIHLEIIQRKDIHRIYWEKYQVHPMHKLGQQRGTFQTEGTLLRDDQLSLAPHVITFRKGTPATTLFEIKIGNTGKSGNGYVKAVLDLSLQFKENTLNSLVFNQRGNQEDLLHFSGSVIGVYRTPVFLTVKEGEVPKLVVVELHSEVIEGIHGGQTTSSQIEVKATLTITIEDGQGHQRQHQLSMVAGIGLEKLPGDNWICIDFGTSAIAVATGNWRNYRLLPLQKLVSNRDEFLNIADFDIVNSECDTEFFLPSYIACDADLRQGEAETDKVRKGFPSFHPASLKPGDPDFVSLPATSARLMEYPGRVVYSLKSWFAQLSQTISLQESIDIKESNGREVKRAQLPLEDLVQSGLAALAEAYITYFSCETGFDEDEGGFTIGGQLVLSCPNTFTSFHRQKFQEVAWKALNGPLGIGMRKHISLISESDAVAYYHCQQRLKQNKHRTGTERLLVYDFGAGTLDLSLVNITWNQDGTYPDQWEVENRLGVPIAGNYIDSRLACLVDKLLKSKSVLRGVFEYRYPVVAKKLTGNDGDKLNYRNAIYQLWQEIRKTKHSWHGDRDFVVRVGSHGGNCEVVKKTDNTDNNNTPDPKKARLTADGDLYFLSIPATMVHDHMKSFIQFVTETVIDELLGAVPIQVSQVDTVIVSGRGALWPGLREHVWNKFPHISNEDRDVKPDFVTDSNQAKNVVVHGAIAWQALSLQKGKAIDAKVVPRLAILRNQTQQLTFEEDWQEGKQPIDLHADPTFQLVQVFLKNPNPKKDFNSLKRYFYIKVGGEIRRDDKWSTDPRLYVRKIEEQGQITVLLENNQGDSINPMTMEARHSTLLPPWPIGKVLLDPSECNI